MNRNRVMRGLGLIALVMLAFGLAGCGSEPAPVARPPAPPPAPPPFQPQAVEVALGESGETVTLMTAEGGGFTLSGEAFAGGEVTAENGNMYLLALADGTWTAAFQEPEGIEVMLGDHGGTVIITMTEDGKYFIGEMEIMADSMVMGENGQYYTPALDDEGMWVAMWVMPDAVSVMLGDHGGTVMLQLAEDNSWWIGETAFASGDMQMGDNGQYYALTYDMDSGMWMAMYTMPDPVSVMLGDHGGSRMLQLAEDNTWWYDGMLFEDDDMLMGDNGHMYTLSMDEEGMWMAMWMKPAAVMVELGTSGSAELQQAEDLTWWIGEMAFDSGGTTTAANGNMYMLTYDMDSGMWSSAFVPMEMEIMGTGLVAMTREADDMYDVGGSEDTLSADGMGDVTADGAMYHVWMDGGMLTGARYDTAIVTGPYEDGPKDDLAAGSVLRTPADVALSEDDPATPGNEMGTKLMIGGKEYSIGTLHGAGTSSITSKTFVETAREELEKILVQVSSLSALNAGLDKEDRTDFTTTYDKKWETDAQKAVDTIFGKVSGASAVPLERLLRRGGKVVEDNMIADFEKLVDALSSEEAFMEAMEQDGIFEDATDHLEEMNRDAATVFQAVQSESAISFGANGTTRYGVFAETGRNIGTDKLEFKLHDTNPEDDQGAIGAFAYATEALTGRTSFLPSEGNATYTGETLAVSGAKEPMFYSGTLDMQVRFSTKRVSAEVTGLVDEDGQAWRHTLRDVESILLPTATLGRNASFKVSQKNASLTYTGFASTAQPATADFSGWLLGTEDTPSGATGTWAIGTQNDKDDYLVGAFGASLAGTTPGDRPPDTIGASIRSMVSLREDDTTHDDEPMKIFARDDLLRFDLDPDRPDLTKNRYIEISIDTLEADDDGAYARTGRANLDVLRENIEKELIKLEANIALDEADGEGFTPALLIKRDEIWRTIRLMLREEIFGLTIEGTLEQQLTALDEETEHKILQEGVGRPLFDAELGNRPQGNEETGFTVPDGDDDDLDADPVALDTRTELTVLSEKNYPRKRGDEDKALDASAVQEIELVLEALADTSTLTEALSEGGIFDGIREETGRTVYRDANYDGYADLDGEAGDDDRKRRVQSQAVKPSGTRGNVTVRLLKTDYTSFGVAWGAVGADGNHFAYSVLPQTRFPADYTRFPGRAKATYKGETIVVRGSTPYSGTANLDVTWAPTIARIGESKLVATFSNLIDEDGNPYAMSYVMVDSSGNRYLANGRTVSDGIFEYTYRNLSPSEVGGVGGALGETIDEPMAKLDPRNRAAASMEFEVESLIFHRNIVVTNVSVDGDGAVSFANGEAQDRTVDIIWTDKSFGVTKTNANGTIQGEFLGQGDEGPLAAIGIWSVTDQIGAVRADPQKDTAELIIVDAEGFATFDLIGSPADAYALVNSGNSVSGNFETVKHNMLGTGMQDTGQEYGGVFVDGNTDSGFVNGIKAGSTLYGAFGVEP